MTHHDPADLEEALKVDPFRLSVWSAGAETMVEYHDDDQQRHIASAVVRLLADGGVEWTRFWVHDDYQGRGIFTAALKWAAKQPSSTIAADTPEADFYQRAGFEVVGGELVLDAKKTKVWLKGR